MGAVGLIRENSKNAYMRPNEVEVGYWIGQPFWGNGYIPAAVEALLSLSFEYLKVENANFPAVLEYMKENNFPLAGAVHDFTDPATGKGCMLFPIQKL